MKSMQNWVATLLNFYLQYHQVHYIGVRAIFRFEILAPAPELKLSKISSEIEFHTYCGLTSHVHMYGHSHTFFLSDSISSKEANTIPRIRANVSSRTYGTSPNTTTRRNSDTRGPRKRIKIRCLRTRRGQAAPPIRKSATLVRSSSHRNVPRRC